MTQYIMMTDKNGKARYYKVVDGKKKVIGKAEYDANIAAVEETVEAVAEVAETAEVVAEATEAVEVEVAAAEIPQSTDVVEVEKIPQITEVAKTAKPSENAVTDDGKAIAEIALSIVKSIIEATGSKHSDKIRLQVKKNCVLINYRNCMVCSLMFDEEHSAKALKFMGNTLETRKQASVYEYGDLNSHKEEIVKQANFIDWWYANTTRKAA